MQPELLAQHERELVAFYAEESTRLGAPLSTEEAWEQYRGFSFQTLMTAVVSLGLGSFTDSDAVIRAISNVRWLQSVDSTSRAGSIASLRIDRARFKWKVHHSDAIMAPMLDANPVFLLQASALGVSFRLRFHVHRLPRG